VVATRSGSADIGRTEKECDQREEWQRSETAQARDGHQAIAAGSACAQNRRSALRAEDAPRYEREGRGRRWTASSRLLSGGMFGRATPGHARHRRGRARSAGRGASPCFVSAWAELRPSFKVPEASPAPSTSQATVQWDLWFPDYDIPVGYGQTACCQVLVGVAVLLTLDPGAHDRLQGVADVPRWPSRSRRRARQGAEIVFMTVSRPSRGEGARGSSTPRTTALEGTLAMGSIVLAKGHPERKGVVDGRTGISRRASCPGGTLPTVTTSTPSSMTGSRPGRTCGCTRT